MEIKIIEAVASVRPEMLVKTWTEIKSRLEILAGNGGRHIALILKGELLFYQKFVATLIRILDIV